jgi:hypothetical protein
MPASTISSRSSRLCGASLGEAQGSANVGFGRIAVVDSFKKHLQVV